jgi:hypothetical protein
MRADQYVLHGRSQGDDPRPDADDAYRAKRFISNHMPLRQTGLAPGRGYFEVIFCSTEGRKEIPAQY